MGSGGKAALAGKLSKAATVAAPELAIPAKLIAELAKSRTPTPQTSSVSVQTGGGTILAELPPDPLIVLRKARVRVVEKKGQLIVITQGARGLHARDVIAGAVVVGAAVGGYELYKAVNGQLSSLMQGPHSTASWPASINPGTWRL